jgi:hypothetical protein
MLTPHNLYLLDDLRRGRSLSFLIPRIILSLVKLKIPGGWMGHGLNVGEVGPVDVGEMEDGMFFSQNTQ